MSVKKNAWSGSACLLDEGYYTVPIYQQDYILYNHYQM